MNKSDNHSGFTLLELVLVTILIGVIASAFLLLIHPKKQMDKAWDMQRKHDLSILRKTFEEYYSDKNRFPNDLEVCTGGTTEFEGECGCSICGRSNTNALSSYLPRLHCDPEYPKKNYMYFYDCVKNSWYKICSTLSTGEAYCVNSPNTQTGYPSWWIPAITTTLTPTPYVPVIPSNTPTPHNTPTPTPLYIFTPTPTPTSSYTTGSCIKQTDYPNCLTYCQSLGKNCGKNEDGYTYKGYPNNTCTVWNNNGCISITENPNDSPCCTSWPYIYPRVTCICDY